MVASKETIDQKENKLIGTTNLTPIVDRFYGSLYQFAVRLSRSESDAADLVQQTFFTLIQHLHQIRDLSSIKCWLFTTLRRNFLMEVRHRTKHREIEFLPDVHGLQTEDPSPWSSLDALTVPRALLQVDETYRTALELFYVNNFSYREIGKALEIPIGTVMSRLSRGKAQLKSILLRNIYGHGRERSGKIDPDEDCGWFDRPVVPIESVNRTAGWFMAAVGMIVGLAVAWFFFYLSLLSGYKSHNISWL